MPTIRIDLEAHSEPRASGWPDGTVLEVHYDGEYRDELHWSLCGTLNIPREMPVRSFDTRLAVDVTSIITDDAINDAMFEHYDEVRGK